MNDNLQKPHDKKSKLTFPWKWCYDAKVLKTRILLQWILPVNLKLLLYHLQQQAVEPLIGKTAQNYFNLELIITIGKIFPHSIVLIFSIAQILVIIIIQRYVKLRFQQSRFLTMASLMHFWRGCCLAKTWSADVDDDDERNPSMFGGYCRLYALQIWHIPDTFKCVSTLNLQQFTLFSFKTRHV